MSIRAFLTISASVAMAPAALAFDMALVEKGIEMAGTPVVLGPKTIGILQQDAQAEGAFRIAEGARVPAEHLGWNVIICDGAGDPDRMASCSDSLLTQGADAILSVAIEPVLVLAQLHRAHAAGVPWITLGSATAPSELITAQYAPLETEMSDALHAYVITQLDQRPGSQHTIGIATSHRVRAAKIRSDALYEDLKTTDITVVAEHVSTHRAQFSGPQPPFDRQVTAFPDVDALLATTRYAVPSMGQLASLSFQGKAFPERPLIVGYFDDVPNVEAVRAGGVDALVTMRLDASGYVAIDQLAQLWARGRPINTAAYINSIETYGIDLREVSIVTEANLPAPGTYLDPATDYETFFASKWASEFNAGG